MEIYSKENIMKKLHNLKLDGKYILMKLNNWNILCIQSNEVFYDDAFPTPFDQ